MVRRAVARPVDDRCRLRRHFRPAAKNDEAKEIRSGHSGSRSTPTRILPHFLLRKWGPCSEVSGVGSGALLFTACFPEADKTRAFRNARSRSWRRHSQRHSRRPHPTNAPIFTSAMPPTRATKRARRDGCRFEMARCTLSEVHDRHGPEPDISKYDRQMPNVRERSAEFNVTFEPEDYLVKVKSAGKLCSGPA